MMHQGWKNYATWLVFAWITNQEELSTYWQEFSREVLGKEATRTEAILVVAKAIENYLITESINLFKEPCIYQDLLHSAISVVDYRQIATRLIEAEKEDK